MIDDGDVTHSAVEILREQVQSMFCKRNTGRPRPALYDCTRAVSYRRHATIVHILYILSPLESRLISHAHPSERPDEVICGEETETRANVNRGAPHEPSTEVARSVRKMSQRQVRHAALDVVLIGQEASPLVVMTAAAAVADRDHSDPLQTSRATALV